MKRQLVLWLLAAISVFLAGPVGPLLAEQGNSGSITITLPPGLDADERSALIDALGALGRQIAVNDASNSAPVATSDGVITLALTRLDAAIDSWHDLPDLFGQWWQNLSVEAFGQGSSLILLWIAIAVATGAAAEWGLDRVLDGWRRHCNAARPERFCRRMLYSLAWVGLEVLGIATFAVVAMFVGWLLLPAFYPPQFTLVVIVASIVKARLILTLIRFIFSPNRPALRLAPMPDRDAKRVWACLGVSVVVVTLANVGRDVLIGPGTSAEVTALLGIIVAGFAAGVRLWAIFQVREPVRELILRAPVKTSGDVPGPIALLAEIWPIAFSVLVVIDFIGVIFNGLLAEDVRFASLSVGSFLVLAVTPFAVTGYGALIDDLLLSRDEGGKSVGAAGALRAFGQGLILLAAFAFLAQAWGADPFAGEGGSMASTLAAAVIQVGGAVLLGWTIWQGSKLALDYYADDEESEVSEDAMGKPGSRIATVLPFIRVCILVAIIAMSLLMALAALGVEIGPLLAGAGVVGLAVGFGAQTLVKDIITGLFYLLEDAFRKGEYIQCSGGKGVVEKISLRSVQLRHHNGPLHTIPFGSMGNITNHSRDWVRIKLMIRVPFDSDLDKVRKAIKKVGQEMQADPELGPMFLQPLKSQGAVDTDGSGFITSVKFMSRPGEQFVLRREAFARIQKAFQDNGIEFAAPRITVDSDDESERQAAAAAAVREVAEKRN